MTLDDEGLRSSERGEAGLGVAARGKGRSATVAAGQAGVGLSGGGGRRGLRSQRSRNERGWLSDLWVVAGGVRAEHLVVGRMASGRRREERLGSAREFWLLAV
ncbi:uncharacterized protein A4U43_C01F14450 [Asparagus officinalis]|uniref:Uncharacterized protein n=1 Tax=Asparagus officinalis TaxID=4686 RepID=A0A5P1FPW4_ASPOF|nr:uncharacterized protein A4U43_C01F14450 [Asparagus officinalis]